VVAYEPGAFNKETLMVLKNKKHKLKQSKNTWGNMQLVIWDKTDKKMTAASDKRGEGLAKVIP
jgi:gamma-glutamyltranspeptidase/glutathione hydrolase